MASTLLLLLLTLPHQTTGVGVDTAVVCPPDFRAALEPWIAYRRQQGHRLALLSDTTSAQAIRRQIRQLAQGGSLRFVLLVGDAEAGRAPQAGQLARCVPVHRAKAEVNVLWGSVPHIATDNWYADLDDDQSPDLAVGRLTADTPAELESIVKKILDYERSADFGPWRRRLNLVAGIGGFGPMADMILESSARYFLTQDVPADYEVSMTYGSWRSPYCPDPRRFHATTLARLDEGSWFWVYIGHGYHLGLDMVHVPGGEYPILDSSDVPKLRCAHAGPVALFLSCYAGAFDADADCLAEQMLRTPGGPVAILAGSRVTMPYAMSVLARGLMQECFQRHCPTLGEAVLHAKQGLLREPDAKDEGRAMLDAIAGAISPAPKMLAAERLEHVLQFNLVGDPLLRLRYPRSVALKVAATADAGQRLTIAGDSPLAGRATIELVARRDRLTFIPPRRSEYPASPEALAKFQDTYDRANDQRLTSVDIPLAAGPFSVELDVPGEAEGACHVRAYVEGAGDFALGAADVTIAAK